MIILNNSSSVSGKQHDSKIFNRFFSPVPSQPLDVSFRNVTSNSVDVSWTQPEELNGVITGYRLYYMHNNFTDVFTIHSSSPQMQHTLSSLSKSRSYFLYFSFLSLCLSQSLSVSLCLSVSLSLCLSVSLSLCLSRGLSVSLSLCFSVSLSL